MITPDLLATLARMGHGDEIVLADANFPGERINKNIIRCDGSEISDLLGAILQLLPLDQSVKSPWLMMQPTDMVNYNDHLERNYYKILCQYSKDISGAEKVERYEFYQRASKAYVVVMTGTAKRFGNIILKKGIIIL